MSRRLNKTVVVRMKHVRRGNVQGDASSHSNRRNGSNGNTATDSKRFRLQSRNSSEHGSGSLRAFVLIESDATPRRVRRKWWLNRVCPSSTARRTELRPVLCLGSRLTVRPSVRPPGQLRCGPTVWAILISRRGFIFVFGITIGDIARTLRLPDAPARFHIARNRWRFNSTSIPIIFRIKR